MFVMEDIINYASLFCGCLVCKQRVSFMSTTNISPFDKLLDVQRLALKKGIEAGKSRGCC